jgi:agmatinase
MWSDYFEFTPSRDLGVDVLSDLCDLGDLGLLHGDVVSNLRRIENVAREVLSRWGRLLAIGGEHTLSLATARALSSLGSRFTYVHVDAHLDSREEWPPGQSLSHATFVRGILELRPDLVLSLGYRSYDQGERRFLERSGVAGLISTDALRRMGRGKLRSTIRDYIESFGSPVHLSIDIDVLDPVVAPGVSNPEAGGLGYGELLNVIEAVLDYGDVRIVDVVEYSPPNDPGLMTLPTIVKLILDITNAWHGNP